MLDLEDAVAPDDKAAGAAEHHRRPARAGLVAAARCRCASTASTPTGATATSSTSSRRRASTLDQIMIPKVSCAGDVHFVATLLDQIEEAIGLRAPDRDLGADRDRDRHGQHRRDRDRRARRGWRRWSSAWPTTPPRCRATRRRSAARTRTTRCSPTRTGRRSATATGATSGTTRSSRIAVTCRAHGLRPIDGPFGDFNDPEGFLAAARRAAVLGYEGKWAIHPSQIDARQRGLHARRAHRRQDPPDHRGDARRRRERQRARSRSTAGSSTPPRSGWPRRCSPSSSRSRPRRTARRSPPRAAPRRPRGAPRRPRPGPRPVRRHLSRRRAKPQLNVRVSW